jgi:hypothetical protein
MAVETGIATYALTGGSYANALHLVRPGTRWGQGAPSQSRDALSGAVKVGGAIVEIARVQLFPVDANCLIDKVLRATLGALPPDAILELGNSSKSIKDTAWKCNACEIECEANGALQVSYEFVNATKPTYSTGGSPGTLVKTTFEWWRGSVTTGGANKKARRIRFRIGNNIQAAFDLGSKASNKRYPTSLAVGAMTVEAEVEYMDDPGHDTSADELPTSTIVLTAVNNAGTPKTITATATSMKVPQWYFEPGGASQFNRYTVPYEQDDNDLTGFTLAIA